MERKNGQTIRQKVGDLVRELQTKRSDLARELELIDAQLKVLRSITGENHPKQSRIGEPTPSSRASKARVSKKGLLKRRSLKKSKQAPVASAKKKQDKELTLKDQIVSYAKSHGGVLAIRDAAAYLVRSGRYSTKEQASANIHQAIRYYSGVFARDPKTKGTYKLQG